ERNRPSDFQVFSRGRGRIDENVVSPLRGPLVARACRPSLLLAAEPSTDGWYGMRGIIDILIGRLLCWSGCREASTSAQRDRLACGVQKIFGRLSSGEWPVIFVAPLICSHNKNLDWLAIRELVLCSLK